MGNTYCRFGFVYVLAAGTACTISDELFGVFAGGTMAHSWVQMFDSELDAFRAYCQTYPDNATLLVDTYNSLQSGVPNAIRAFNEVLRPKGITHCGIRFDSGDIAYLTKKARKMLDDAGWQGDVDRLAVQLQQRHGVDPAGAAGSGPAHRLDGVSAGLSG